MKDLVIDTNALILYILGTINPRYIGRHKRLSVFTQNEYNAIIDLIQCCDRIVSTPNVWTEVDNLCNDLSGEDKYKYTMIMRQIICDSHEKYVESKAVVESEYFAIVGITDTAILSLANDCFCFITGDTVLADYARSLSINVLDLKALVNASLSQ